MRQSLAIYLSKCPGGIFWQSYLAGLGALFVFAVHFLSWSINLNLNMGYYLGIQDAYNGKFKVLIPCYPLLLLYQPEIVSLTFFNA